MAVTRQPTQGAMGRHNGPRGQLRFHDDARLALRAAMARMRRTILRRLTADEHLPADYTPRFEEDDTED